MLHKYILFDETLHTLNQTLRFVGSLLPDTTTYRSRVTIFVLYLNACLVKELYLHNQYVLIHLSFLLLQKSTLSFANATAFLTVV